MADPERMLEGAHLKLRKVRFIDLPAGRSDPRGRAGRPDARGGPRRGDVARGAPGARARPGLTAGAWPSPRGSRQQLLADTCTTRASASGAASAATRATRATPRDRPRLHRRLLERPHASPPARATSTCSGRATCRSQCPSLVRLGPRRAGAGRRSPTRSRLDHASQPRHDDDPLLRSPGRRLRLRRRLAAALPRRARAPARRPGRAAPRLARAPRSPTSPSGSSTRATGLVRGDRTFSAHRDTVRRTAATRSATRWSRCSRRRSPRRAGSSRRSSATSAATTAAADGALLERRPLPGRARR